MHYSFVKSILSSVWHVHGSVLSEHAYMLNPNFDYDFINEGEPQESIPFAISSSHNVVSDYYGDNKTPEEEIVAVIPIRGVMLKNDAPCGPRGMRTIGSRIRQSAKDPNVVAILVPIESGGGQSVAVPEVAEAIQEAQKSIPVIGWVDGMMASAALYAGSYMDRMIASRETDTVGSIGTMIEMAAPPKVATLADGRKYVRVYADGSEEKNEEFETAINDSDFKLMKERILNPHLKQFHADIKANCPNVTEDHLKGRTWPASEVMGVFVDEIGDMNHAVDVAFEMGRARKKENKLNQSNDTNQNSNTMKYSNINSIVGAEMESTNEGMHLTHDQAEAIDTALGAEHPTQEQLDAANATATAHEATIAERDATISTLQAENAELKKNAGAPPAVEVVEEVEEVSDFASAKELFDSVP